MLTEEQKMQLEKIYNAYSLWKAFESESRAEYNTKMCGFRTAVSALGYKFMFDRMQKELGVEYQSYKLEEINM